MSLRKWVVANDTDWEANQLIAAGNSGTDFVVGVQEGED
jgi:hypothetical protein